MLKRFFYISLFLLILTLIILVAYNVAFKSNPSSPKASGDTPKEALESALKESSEEPVLSGKIEQLLTEEVMGASIGTNGNLYYYSISDKELKTASFEGKDKKTLLSNLPGVPERVLWSPKKDQCVIGLRQGSSLRFHHLDITTKTLTPLKPQISRVAWSGGGESIFYQYKTPSGEYTLDRSNPDGTNFQTIAPLGKIEHFIEVIPQSNRVSFWTRPTGLETTIFESVNDLGQDRKILLENRYGADYLWAPNGKKVVFSSVVSRASADISLGLMNENGGEIISLAIPTLISKAVWAKDTKTLYYALPGDISQGSVLPNDYYQNPIFTKDTFWKIDTETGQKSRLLELEESLGALDSSNLFLSPKEDYLFFTDRKTNRLYRIEL
jgi:hypothetical protein